MIPQKGITPHDIPNPGDRVYTCSLMGCDKQFTHNAAFRTHIVVMCTGWSGIGAFECMNDHFACCPDHALQVALGCYQAHIEPAYRQVLTERGHAYGPES